MAQSQGAQRTLVGANHESPLLRPSSRAHRTCEHPGRRRGAAFLLLAAAAWSLALGERAHARALKVAVAPTYSERLGGQRSPSTEDVPDLAQEALRIVEERLKSVHGPDRALLAGALGVAEVSPDTAGNAGSALFDFTGLEGRDRPELILKWTQFSASGSSGQEDSDSRSWVLLLLAWDGAQWRTSKILLGDEPFSLMSLPQPISGAASIAVLLSEEEQRIPYPEIFQVHNGTAVLVWDSRSDDSRYQGYAGGKVEFRPAGLDAPEMVASGKADPGLIAFPPGSRRGFEATTVYRWGNGAYVPVKTEYASNPDYTLYRFISALHLHDFHAAYTEVDPARFLNTDHPTLELFRRQIEDSWPEFVDDQLFEVRPDTPGSTPGYAFELVTEGERVVYVPHFSEDSRQLIVGLEKQKLK